MRKTPESSDLLALICLSKEPPTADQIAKAAKSIRQKIAPILRRMVVNGQILEVKNDDGDASKFVANLEVPEVADFAKQILDDPSEIAKHLKDVQLWKRISPVGKSPITSITQIEPPRLKIIRGTPESADLLTLICLSKEPLSADQIAKAVRSLRHKVAPILRLMVVNGLLLEVKNDDGEASKFVANMEVPEVADFAKQILDDPSKTPNHLEDVQLWKRISPLGKSPITPIKQIEPPEPKIIRKTPESSDLLKLICLSKEPMSADQIAKAVKSFRHKVAPILRLMVVNGQILEVKNDDGETPKFVANMQSPEVADFAKNS